jgi:hypothetical protein
LDKNGPTRKSTDPVTLPTVYGAFECRDRLHFRLSIIRGFAGLLGMNRQVRHGVGAEESDPPRTPEWDFGEITVSFGSGKGFDVSLGLSSLKQQTIVVLELPAGPSSTFCFRRV